MFAYAESVKDLTSLSDTATKRIVTFGASAGPLTIEAYNDCPKGTKTANLDITAIPTSLFTFKQGASALVDFTASYLSTPTATYAWTFGDANATTGTGRTTKFTYPYANATYDATLVVSNACGTSTKTVKPVAINITSLDDLSSVAGIKIYPTVTSSNLNVELTGSATFSVVNVIGHVSSTSTISGSGSIDVSSLPSGVYFLNIVKDGKAYVTRFVKQ